MKNYEYTPVNICPKKITFGLDGGKVTNVEFHGGCGGNSKGMANLLEGADVKDAIKRLKGVPCGNRGTSCPNELAKALTQAMDE